MQIKNEGEFERFISEAEKAPFSGWDFSFMEGRWREASLSWFYREIVIDRMRGVQSMLDMGTGGGEFLSGLTPLPPDTWATEAYPPNVPIAKARLEPLGVTVLQIESDDHLPLEDQMFDLVINRHEAFDAGEVYRILKPGGKFITQQIGGQNNIGLNELIEGPKPQHNWNLASDVAHLRKAGFHIVQRREEFPITTFDDIGVVVYYLKVISWQIEGFSVARYRDRLATIHNKIVDEGGLKVAAHRTFIEAVRPV